MLQVLLGDIPARFWFVGERKMRMSRREYVRRR
jgi:hypothetical protein